ncbi:MAG: hypothetical protein M3T56_08835 [Chloroflexota bacterium]|nr:hypothetical protein [Chloroflexota bacterium]
MDDQLVPAQIAQRLDLDRMGAHQYRLVAAPVPGDVAVEGSVPEALGGFWVASTA